MDTTGEPQKTRTLSPLLRSLLRLKFWLAEHLRLSERQLTLIWAGLIGVLGALASDGFRKASELLQYVATGSSSAIITSFVGLTWWQRLTVPIAGGLLAGLTLWFGNRLFASVRQKTTTDYMEAIVVGSGNISVRASVVKSVSALFSISTGTSIGREGPTSENIEILLASHIGLGGNAAALWAIADRLAQKEGEFAPFRRSGPFALAYGKLTRGGEA